MELNRKNCDDELQIMNAFSLISQLNLTKTNFLFLESNGSTHLFEDIECIDSL